MAKRVGIIYCKRIQDESCVGCAKCYKAANDRLHAFEGDEEIKIVFKCSCGDCPGLVLPKIGLQMTVIEKLGERIDELYFATCVEKAKSVMNCPMNLDTIREKLANSLQIPVNVGTHQL